LIKVLKRHAMPQNMCGVITVFHPNFTDVYIGLTNRGAIVSTVLSEKLAGKLKANCYDEFKNLVGSKKSISMYVPGKPG
jgi:predicted transcriptional regulator